MSLQQLKLWRSQSGNDPRMYSALVDNIEQLVLYGVLDFCLDDSLNAVADAIREDMKSDK